MADLVSLKATVSGRVQGVFFRAFVQRWAEQLRLTGYVHNLPDGTVEVVAEGDRQQLEKLAGYLQQGPPPARVAKVTAVWGESTGGFSGFKVRY